MDFTQLILVLEIHRLSREDVGLHRVELSDIWSLMSWYNFGHLVLDALDLFVQELLQPFSLPEMLIPLDFPLFFNNHSFEYLLGIRLYCDDDLGVSSDFLELGARQKVSDSALD